jgi:protein-disulfide isomerase
MKTTNLRLAIAALALALAAGRSAGAAPASPGAPPPAPARAAAPAEGAAADPALPGVDLEGLTPEQRQTLADWAKDAFCYCGCPHTLGQCLREHRACKHAPRMARLAVRLLKAGVRKPDLARTIEGYYASFEKRAKLDVSRFGPPLGDPSAPVSIVEFSDFKCPFCQMVRPGIEGFVNAHAGRVRFFYKPFPIESHPGALDAAQAGEWARDAGHFWPMHDAMFENPRAISAGDLADLARGVGGDPADLRAALEDKRYVPKIRESQAEARAAGIRGTPTIFFDGRVLVVSDLSDEGLLFTLEDEEEWQAQRGWTRD